ncbi:MAG: hypothetical protein GY778_04665 [bacterium]|nr:hypothetical protein [bacterium]
MTTITQETRFQRTRCSAVPAALVVVGLLLAPLPTAQGGCDLLVETGDTYTVSGGETYNSVCIEGKGTIDIPAGASLQVDRALSVSEKGTIQFSGSSGSRGIFEVGGNLRMDGRFKVAGSVGGTIQSSRSTNVLTISASGKIEAPDGPLTLSASLEMDGTVTADGPYAIEVTDNGPGAGSSGRWEVTDAGGKIKIKTTSAVSLNSAQILISAGTFQCKESFTTGGGVKLTGGKIKVSNGKTFTASGPYTGP